MNCGYGQGLSVLEVLDAVDRAHQSLRSSGEMEGRRAGDPPQLIAANERHAGDARLAAEVCTTSTDRRRCAGLGAQADRLTPFQPFFTAPGVGWSDAADVRDRPGGRRRHRVGARKIHASSTCGPWCPDDRGRRPFDEQAEHEWPRRDSRSPRREHPADRQPDGHFYADVRINGNMVHMLVDTGATGIALSRDDARTAGLAPSIGMSDVVGEGADGAVRGEYVRLDRVELGPLSAEGMNAVVLNGGQQSLLGRASCRSSRRCRWKTTGWCCARATRRRPDALTSESPLS